MTRPRPRYVDPAIVAIRLLTEHPEGMTAEQIADQSGMSHQRAVYVLDYLAGKGTIERIPVTYRSKAPPPC